MSLLRCLFSNDLSVQLQEESQAMVEPYWLDVMNKKSSE